MNLQQLNIEDRDEQKYATKCPKCAPTRHKEGTSSLMVYKDVDATRYECMHPTCEWYQNRQFIKASSEGERECQSGIAYQIPIPENAGPPPCSGDSLAYEYRNANNELLYYLIRTQDKKFFPMARTSSGEWIAKKPPIKALYGAELLKDKKDYVIVVEGEKAADAAREIFTNATVVTWQGGASSVKNGDWDLLEGRKIVLWPDNDEPGRQAMKTAAGLISGSVSIVDVSSLPPKADLADDISREDIMRIWNTRTMVSSPPKVTGAYSGKDLRSKILSMRTGEQLGWSNMRDFWLPSSGIVIVEGRTKHGKSTFMNNIVINKLMEDRDSLVFYSYELPAGRILLNMAMGMDGRVLDERPALNIEKYCAEIETGSYELFNALEEKCNTHLTLTDSKMLPAKLLDDIKSHTFKRSMVFIDYLQNIPTASEQARYSLLKELVSDLQDVAHKNNMVIFLGSQLTPGDKPEQDTPYECRGIHHSAEMVLRIWNKNAGEAMGVIRKDLEDLPGNVIIECRMNRNNAAGQKFCFNLVNGTKLQAIDSEGEF